MPNFKQIKFNIDGLRCKSCKVLLETEVGAMAGVKSINVSYQTGKCEVEFDEITTNFSEIRKKIEKFDYSVNQARKLASGQIGEQAGVKTFVIGLLVSLVIIGFVFGYFYIQNSGALSVLARLNEKNLGYGLIFVIGLLASFHCVGMCGGLVVTYSAGIAAKDQANKFKQALPHLSYNLGRLISYSIIGGILGGIGSFFAINQYFSGSLMIIAGIFMIIMAINLATNFSPLQKLSLRMPQFLAKLIFSQKYSNKPKGPFIIGLMTGLMPCGPLQAMQLYALGTGSFLAGALSLGVYALGTIPLMFGFGTLISLISKKYMKKAMKISAVVVVILALIMIGRGLASIQAGNIVNRQESRSKNQEASILNSKTFQEVRMAVTPYGYQPNVLYIKKGLPVRWIIDGSGISGCTSAIQIPSLGIRQSLFRGENIIEFTAYQAGELPFACGMQMVWGKFIVQ